MQGVLGFRDFYYLRYSPGQLETDKRITKPIFENIS